MGFIFIRRASQTLQSAKLALWLHVTAYQHADITRGKLYALLSAAWVIWHANIYILHNICAESTHGRSVSWQVVFTLTSNAVIRVATFGQDVPVSAWDQNWTPIRAEVDDLVDVVDVVVDQVFCQTWSGISWIACGAVAAARARDTMADWIQGCRAQHFTEVEFSSWCLFPDVLQLWYTCLTSCWHQRVCRWPGWVLPPASSMFMILSSSTKYSAVTMRDWNTLYSRGLTRRHTLCAACRCLRLRRQCTPVF